MTSDELDAILRFDSTFDYRMAGTIYTEREEQIKREGTHASLVNDSQNL
jgi:hypothetical protein